MARQRTATEADDALLSPQELGALQGRISERLRGVERIAGNPVLSGLLDNIGDVRVTFHFGEGRARGKYQPEVWGVKAYGDAIDPSGETIANEIKRLGVGVTVDRFLQGAAPPETMYEANLKGEFLHHLLHKAMGPGFRD